ncbi:MAG: protein kinase, partial [Anaerolineales bacterium]|nr:protein kinase [Anaerolineales bacterium]
TQTNLGTEGRTRLLREARAAARLNHPNIVSVFDAGEGEDGTPFIVMEWVDGQSLYQRWPLPPEEIFSTAKQICAALEHAHTSQIVHRDLKLENVLLTTTGQVKLTDFGLARSVASRVTQEGSLTGTVFYIAPEQIMGQAVDGRTDLYALGVVLYELTTGKLPFNAEDPLAVLSQHLYAPIVPPRTHQPELSPALDELIVRLLAKAPDERPASAGEVLHALEAIERGATAGSESPASPLDRLVRGRLIGREAERAEMTALWKQVKAGESQVLLISGEPGIGKTRLVRELMTLVEVSGGAAYMGECYAEGSAPYAPLAQIVQAASPLTAPLPTGEEAGGEGELPQLILADLLTIAPALHSQFPNVPHNPPLEPQAEQQRLFESALELCARQARRQPLCLVLDDAHWADSGTLYLIRHLARRLRSLRLPVLLVLTYREVELDQSRALNDVVADLQRERLAARLKLTRLTREQARTLLEVMFETEISDELLDDLYRETEGNPFFIEEVCKALVEQGAIYRENGTWQRRDLASLQIPQSVRVAIQSRVSQLLDAAQTALRLAAVIGREFDFPLLLRAGELNEDALVEALETAERAQLIEELRGVRNAGREAFTFVHALIPAALRESVSGLRRHRMHKRVAAALEQLRPDDFETLAYHYGQAGDETRARLYYRKAGDRARAVYANDDAIRFYTEALTLMPEGESDQFELLASRARLYDFVGRRPEQKTDVEALTALAEKLDDDARRLEALLAQGDYEAAVGFVGKDSQAQRAVELARQLKDPAREGRALIQLGWITRLLNNFTQSRDALRAAAEIFKREGLLSEAAESLHTLSLVLSDLNEMAEAQTIVREALALSQQAKDKRQEATSLRRIAILLKDEDKDEEALRVAEQALALHRQLGDRESECHALNIIGMLHRSLGRPLLAENYIRQSIELAEAINSSVGYINAIGNYYFTYLVSRQYEACLNFIQNELLRPFVQQNHTIPNILCLNLSGVLADIGQHERTLAIQAEIPLEIHKLFGSTLKADGIRALAELGRFAESRSLAQRQVELSRTENSPLNLARNQYELSYVLLLESEAGSEDATLLPQALTAIDEALQIGGGHKFFDGMAYGQNYKAEFLLALGQLPEALAASEKCLDYSERRHLTSYFLYERFWSTHARILRAVGRTSEADEYLRRAHDLMNQVAVKFTDAELRRGWLENVRANRHIQADVAKYLA